jgi:hypothetical protein
MRNDAGLSRVPLLPAPRSIFAGGQVVGRVEPASGGFHGRTASGELVGSHATEREAVSAVHDHVRRERIARAHA